MLKALLPCPILATILPHLNLLDLFSSIYYVKGTNCEVVDCMHSRLTRVTVWLPHIEHDMFLLSRIATVTSRSAGETWQHGSEIDTLSDHATIIMYSTLCVFHRLLSGGHGKYRYAKGFEGESVRSAESRMII
jgi:hypothetical protein